MWACLNEKNSIIHSKQHSGIKTLERALIEKDSSFKTDLFVTPSKFLSTVKGIFKPIFEDVHNVIISKANFRDF